MENNELVAVFHFCVTHEIEVSFIDRLQQSGLIEITMIDDQSYLQEDQLSEVEKLMRLHFDLDINFEGMEAIGHLLERLQQTTQQNIQLQNRLSLYENINHEL